MVQYQHVQSYCSRLPNRPPTRHSNGFTRLSLQGDVRFAEVMGLLGAKVEWAPYSITITG